MRIINTIKALDTPIVIFPIRTLNRNDMILLIFHIIFKQTYKAYENNDTMNIMINIFLSIFTDLFKIITIQMSRGCEKKIVIIKTTQVSVFFLQFLL